MTEENTNKLQFSIVIEYDFLSFCNDKGVLDVITYYINYKATPPIVNFINSCSTNMSNRNNEIVRA